MGVTLQYQPVRLPNCVDMCLLESRQVAQNGLAMGSDTCRQLMGRWHQQTWLKQISWDLICLPLRRWWVCDKNFLWVGDMIVLHVGWKMKLGIELKKIFSYCGYVVQGHVCVYAWHFHISGLSLLLSTRTSFDGTYVTS